MRNLNKAIALTLACFLSHQAFADKTSCAHVLRLERRQIIYGNTSVAILFLPALPFSIADDRLRFHHLGKNIEHLKAASILRSNKSTRSDLRSAEKTIEEFYAKIIRLSPQTRLSKQEVIDLLESVYTHGVPNGSCYKLTTESLYTAYFQYDHLSSSYWESHRKWEQQAGMTAKNLEDAAAERARKNASYANREEEAVFELP